MAYERIKIEITFTRPGGPDSPREYTAHVIETRRGKTLHTVKGDAEEKVLEAAKLFVEARRPNGL